MRRTGLVMLAAAGALSGCVTEMEDEGMLGQTELEIVNGLIDSGHPSVARVFAAGVTTPGKGEESCTGTLITHSSVLTAAHCVTNGATHLVRFANGSQFFGVATRHPDYSGPGGGIHDIAVVSTLDKVGRPFYSSLAVQVQAWDPITLVGYGRTAAATPADGQKRYGTNTIDWLDANFFYFDTTLTDPAGQESATCYGDSGGPAFLGGITSECVGGVTSGQNASSSTACTAAGDEWRHTRVDIHLTWLEEVTRDPIQTCQ